MLQTFLLTDNLRWNIFRAVTDVFFPLMRIRPINFKDYTLHASGVEQFANL